MKHPALCALLLLLAVPACSPSRDLNSRTFITMGTFGTLTMQSGQEESDKYFAIVDNSFREVETTLSAFSTSNDLASLNRSAGQWDTHVDTMTRAVLDQSLRCSRISDGCFDPTVAPLARLWGFNGGERPKHKPDQKIIEHILDTAIGYKNIRIKGDNVMLQRAGMRLDFGGIAKGYAVDLCYQRLEDAGATDFIVDLGGNIRCRKKSDDAKPWRIGVRNPFDEQDIIGSLAMNSGMAVATSGNYERFVNIDGQRYAHIIDPRTGIPVTGMAGVTVVSTNATEADGMSTALFVAGLKAAPAILARTPGSQALFVPDRQPITIYITPGFRDIFTPATDYRDSVVEMEMHDDI